jgi:ATP-dependent Clp protease protease subunit
VKYIITIMALLAATWTTSVQAKDNRSIFIEGRVAQPGILQQADDLSVMATESNDPILIYINSPGGQVFAGLQFINSMRFAKAKGIELKCYVTGMAASMAFQFLAECTERYALAYSLLLWHPVRTSGFMTMTPLRARYIADDLTRIEGILVAPLKEALDISPASFNWHYINETMWTAHGLSLEAPNFLTILDSIPGVSARTWKAAYGEADGETEGEVDWNDFEIDYSL